MASTRDEQNALRLSRGRAEFAAALHKQVDPQIVQYMVESGRGENVVAQLFLHNDIALTLVVPKELTKGVSVFLDEWRQETNLDMWLAYAYIFVAWQEQSDDEIEAPELDTNARKHLVDCISIDVLKGIQPMVHHRKKMRAASTFETFEYSKLYRFYCFDRFNTGVEGSKLLPSPQMDHEPNIPLRIDTQPKVKRESSSHASPQQATFLEPFNKILAFAQTVDVNPPMPTEAEIVAKTKILLTKDGTVAELRDARENFAQKVHKIKEIGRELEVDVYFEQHEVLDAIKDFKTAKRRYKAAICHAAALRDSLI